MNRHRLNLTLCSFLLLALLLQGCRPQTDPPGAAATLPPAFPHSAKGYELYSWHDAEVDAWRYALMTGTNRRKTVAEILAGDDEFNEDGWVKVSVGDAGELLPLLERLPAGEQIFWLDQAVPAAKSYEEDPFALPAPAVVERVSLHCAELGLNLTLPPSPAPGATSEPALPETDSSLVAILSLPASLPPGDPVPLHFTLRNVGPDPLYVLTWYTPLEGIAGKIFDVARDGERLPYLGILATRAGPSSQDYVLLKPGGSASTEVDLSSAYDFSTPGVYTVAFRSPTISHVARSEAALATSVDALGPVSIPSEPVTVTIVAAPNTASGSGEDS